MKKYCHKISKIYLNFSLSIGNLGLGQLGPQFLKLGVGLLEVIVVVELKRVLVVARRETAATATTGPASPAASVVAHTWTHC